MATQEIVIVVEKEGHPAYMVRKNGHIEYFKLTPMRWQDHVEMHGITGDVDSEK